MLTNCVEYGNICIVIALAIAVGYINLFFFKWKGGFRMLKELLELSKTTDIVAEDTVEGAKGNVANYDCDP